MADLLITGLTEEQRADILDYFNGRASFGLSVYPPDGSPCNNCNSSLTGLSVSEPVTGGGGAVRLQELSPVEIARNFSDGFQFGFLAFLMPVLGIVFLSALLAFVRRQR